MTLPSRLRLDLFSLARRYDFIIFYALSVALGRGLSIFVLPVTSRFIPPGDYARLDVAASVIEICGLFAGFAMTDLVFRFAAPAKTEEEQRRIASGILGIGLAGAAITFAVTQLVLPLFAAKLSLGVAESSLRIGLAGAACGGLIELPLAWLRMRKRPALYLLFIAGRSIAQIGLMIAVLASGYGPEGVIVSNASLELLLTLILVSKQLQSFGVSLSREMARHALHYSVPIVIGSIAMFGLGTCDRFFLAGAVPAETVAHYTLAGKLAFATPLLLQPFLLWWAPQRISILGEANGVERSGRIVGYGFLVLLVSCALTVSCGAVFIKLAIPPSYHEAARYLPFIVFVLGLNEVATLVNAGSFARSHGRELLYVNGAGGIAAVLGYFVCVPIFGVGGAIAATALGHALRIALFVRLGRESAPIAYPALGVSVMAFSLVALFAFKPSEADPLIDLCFLPLSLAVLWLEAQFFDLLPRPRALWLSYASARKTQV